MTGINKDDYKAIWRPSGAEKCSVLDPDFIPLMRFNHAFLKGAKKLVGIAVERADGHLGGCQSGFDAGVPLRTDPEYGEWYGCLRRDGMISEILARAALPEGPNISRLAGEILPGDTPGIVMGKALTQKCL